MRTRIILAASALMSLFLSGCLHATTFVHEPSMAAAQAERFADASLIEHDLNSAYALLSPKKKEQLSLEQFKDLLARMHPSKYPDAVNATDYELLPSQRGMNIFLFGKSGAERFYYRFHMEGTKETGYAIAGFWRGDAPYPQSSRRRPLK